MYSNRKEKDNFTQMEINDLMNFIAKNTSNGNIKMSEKTIKDLKKTESFFKTISEKFENGFQAFENQVEKMANKIF